jgi:hypothetical protein
MFAILQILTVVIVGLAMALAVAHALEMPGKMRLSKDAYLTVQPIYYPGFTVGGGIGEAGGTILTCALLVLMPLRTSAFWFTLLALLGLVGMQAVYWISTHPVNRYWLQGQTLSRSGSRFFSAGGIEGTEADPSAENWKSLRNRWEYSHVMRAVLALLSFVSLVTAMIGNPRT